MIVLYEKIAKHYGVELYEKFDLIEIVNERIECYAPYCPYMFTEKGLVDSFGEVRDSAGELTYLELLFKGAYRLEKGGE